MMNKLSILFSFVINALLFVSVAVAQDAPNKTDAKGEKQGYWIKYDENKIKTYEGNFINGIPHGKFIYYTDAAKPWAITFFSENGNISRTQHLNNKGKVVGEGKYINQKKDSLWNFYTEEGNLLSVEFYLDGLKNGTSKVYYNNGQLSEEKEWAKGIAEGYFITYFQNGSIKNKGQFINGKAEGKAIYFNPSGKIGIDGFYKNDFKEGPWNFYNEDGTIKKTLLYKNGKAKDKSEDDILTKEILESDKKKYEEK